MLARNLGVASHVSLRGNNSYAHDSVNKSPRSFQKKKSTRQSPHAHKHMFSLFTSQLGKRAAAHKTTITTQTAQQFSARCYRVSCHSGEYLATCTVGKLSRHRVVTPCFEDVQRDILRFPVQRSFSRKRHRGLESGWFMLCCFNTHFVTRHSAAVHERESHQTKLCKRHLSCTTTMA